jgi:hypothetical protein
MRLRLLSLFLAAIPLAVFGQSSNKKPPLPPHPNEPASEELQTETIGPKTQTPAVPSAEASTAGHLEPEQVKALMHKIWLAQYRLNDLLAQVHSEKWNMAPAARASFDQSLTSLHKALATEEDWRSQFDSRPDSLYLGFQTYVAISAVLPRLDGVAHSVSHYENASFGAQYSQAANQLFDLQQLIEPHLAYLLKNQDNFLLLGQTNLAACENELNFAERNKEGRATPMKNIAPEFKGRRRPAHTASPAAGTQQPAPKGAPAAKPAANPPNKSQQK